MYNKEKYLDKYCRDEVALDAAYLLSLHAPSIVASLIAAPVTRKHGRRRSMIISGVSFCIGSAVIAIVPQIIQYGPDKLAIMIGRVIAGVGIGFGTQVS